LDSEKYRYTQSDTECRQNEPQFMQPPLSPRY